MLLLDSIAPAYACPVSSSVQPGALQHSATERPSMSYLKRRSSDFNPPTDEQRRSLARPSPHEGGIEKMRLSRLVLETIVAMGMLAACGSENQTSPQAR